MGTGELDPIWGQGASVVTNDGIIRLGTAAAGATLRIDGSIVEMLGSGTVILYGPGSSLTTTGGGILRNWEGHTIEGQGFIQVPIYNHGLLVVEGGTLTNFQTVYDFGGNTVVLGDAITPATLSISGGFYTHDLTVTDHGRLNVGASRGVDLSGHYYFHPQDETAATWGASSVLAFSGGGEAQGFEIASSDMGAVNAGFSGNFAMRKLYLHTAGTLVFLRDLYDNGNRNGSNGSHEAAYVDVLELAPGTTLNLNGYCLYTKLGGVAHRVLAGEGASFGGGTIVDSSVTDAPQSVFGGLIRQLVASPNPFNPRTEIRFELDRAASVTIAVFDLRGRRMQTLIAKQNFEAGRNVVTWTPSGLPSGHYYLRMMADGAVASRSVTLLK